MAHLIVYDILGRTVAELVNAYKSAGEHHVQFDATALSNGVYLYRLEIGSRTETRKMLLMK